MPIPITRPRARTLLTLLRRTLLGTLLLQLGLAAGMTLVDSYRRRGKRPGPFPTTPPRSVPVGESTVTTYTYGQDLFDDMLAAIEQAEQRVLLETYILKGDEVGERFKQALTDAAQRGVEVYLIYDAFANLVVSPRFKRFPRGVTVMRYPVYNAGLRFFDLRRYGRDHRKILVADDRVGFVGGYNIGRPYATEWRDTHIRITGPEVWDLTRAFADFWNLNRRRLLGRDQRPLLLEAPSTWDPRIRYLRNNPRQWTFPIRAMYLDAINRASRNIWMTHAYFTPDQDFVDALKEAAWRGVDVRLLLPHKSNHIVADWISRGYFAQLLESGVRVFRYREAMVHAKTSTIDGSWSTVGTANVDRLSLQGNYEINVELIDPGFADLMEEVFLTDQGHSLELRTEEWEAREMHRKFTEFVLAPLRPLL